MKTQIHITTDGSHDNEFEEINGSSNVYLNGILVPGACAVSTAADKGDAVRELSLVMLYKSLSIVTE